MKGAPQPGGAVAPTVEVCRRLELLELPIIDDALRHYFREVVNHVQRVNESIDVLREVLTFSFEAGLLQSARQVTSKSASPAGPRSLPCPPRSRASTG
jgi:magnesium transporter